MSSSQHLHFKKKYKALSVKKPSRVSCKDKNYAMKTIQITGYFGLLQLGSPKKIQESNKGKEVD